VFFLVLPVLFIVAVRYNVYTRFPASLFRWIMTVDWMTFLIYLLAQAVGSLLGFGLAVGWDQTGGAYSIPFVPLTYPAPRYDSIDAVTITPALSYAEVAGFEFFACIILFSVSGSFSILHEHLFKVTTVIKQAKVVGQNAINPGVLFGGRAPTQPVDVNVTKVVNVTSTEIAAGFGAAGVTGVIFFVLANIGAYVSGALFNPWRWLWPAVFSNAPLNLSYSAAYTASPICAGIVAAFLVLAGHSLVSWSNKRSKTGGSCLDADVYTNV